MARLTVARGRREGMKRLTTDTPKDNFEMALNLFYVKDKEVWVREYGKNGADISLLNLTREILSYQCPYVEPDISDDDLIMMMPEWLFDDVRARQKRPSETKSRSSTVTSKTPRRATGRSGSWEKA